MKFNHISTSKSRYRVTPKGFVFERDGVDYFVRATRRKTKAFFRDTTRYVRENGGVLARVGK